MKSTVLPSARLLAAFLFILGCTAFTFSQNVERIAAPAGNAISEPLHHSIGEKGYRVTLADAWKAEFWFAKELKLDKRDVPGALYPELDNGEFVGVVRFPQGMSDFRGQSLPPGYYTLRYQMLPEDGNHMGVAPNPDFLLASPAVDDARPEQGYVYRKLVALSAKSTGTGHPAVIALENAGPPGTLAKESTGNLVFSVDVPAVDGSSVKLGIVLRGAATQ